MLVIRIVVLSEMYRDLVFDDFLTCLKGGLEICNEASWAKPTRKERRCAKTPNVGVLSKRIAKEN